MKGFVNNYNAAFVKEGVIYPSELVLITGVFGVVCFRTKGCLEENRPVKSPGVTWECNLEEVSELCVAWSVTPVGASTVGSLAPHRPTH